MERKDHGTVKAAVVKAYELVPEAYRSRFGGWQKTGKQTSVEFSQDLNF